MAKEHPRILIISSKYLPIFNNGNHGAIQKLERIYLKYNETIGDRLTVYSPKIAIDNFDNQKLRYTEFRNVDLTSKKYKILKYFYAVKHRVLGTHNNEYYVRQIIKDLKRRHEENAYNLIIFENEEASIPIFKKHIKTSTPIVLHLHNDYVNVNRKYSKKIVESCDEIWTVSKFIANRVKAVSNIKTIIIPNTFESSKPNTQKIITLKKKFNTEKNTIFIYLGRVKKGKGVLQLMRAFNTYSTNHKNAKLLILGEMEVGRNAKKFNHSIQLEASKNKNIVMVGYVEPREIINYLSIAVLQIIPSVWNEAFGLIVLEGMDAGLPIVATNSGGIPEIGKNEIKYIERENLENNILKALQEFKKQSKVNYSNILKKYTRKRFCQAMHECIRATSHKNKEYKIW